MCFFFQANCKQGRWFLWTSLARNAWGSPEFIPTALVGRGHLAPQREMVGCSSGMCQSHWFFSKGRFLMLFFICINFGAQKNMVSQIKCIVKMSHFYGGSGGFKIGGTDRTFGCPIHQLVSWGEGVSRMIVLKQSGSLVSSKNMYNNSSPPKRSTHKILPPK